MRKQSYFTYLLLSIFAIYNLSGETSWAATLQGRVTAVQSGNQIRITTSDGRHRQVRLLGIRLPSNDWRTAGSAKRHLATLIAGRHVSIEYQTLPGNGVILGRVRHGGADVALRMLEAGLAVVSDKGYLKPETRQIYLASESLARKRKMGFWQTK